MHWFIILFLRNERFFLLNRIFLLAGILTSFFFPFISIHYTVDLPVSHELFRPAILASAMQNRMQADSCTLPDLRFILLVLYLIRSIICCLEFNKTGQIGSYRVIKKTEITISDPVKLIRTPDYTSSFSFFSYVFVNPSVTDLETKEIMNHELVHIRQKHWFDLVAC